MHCVELYPTLDNSAGFEVPMVNVWNVVDLGQTHNYELAMHVTTGIENGEEFYTDLNGFQYTRRKNYRKLTIQGNVYPMPSGAFIQDSESRMTILTGQPLGVASQDKSSLQIFLDRRLDQDDNRGMEQAMNDNILTSSKFVLLFEKINARTFKTSMAKTHPSLLAQTVSFNLISPVAKLILQNKIELVKDIKLDGQKKYPCDLRLVNMRTLQTADEKPEPNEIGLILHRIAHEECSPVVESTNYIQSQCASSSGSGSVSFSDFFSGSSSGSSMDMKISSAYLTMRTKEGKEEKRIEGKELVVAHVQPMQIEAFKINL